MTDLHHLIRLFSRSTLTRSALVGGVDHDSVEAIGYDFDELNRINEQRKFPKGVVIRYPTDLPRDLIMHREFRSTFGPEIDRLRRLTAEPALNRLNHVKQLSTAHLSSAIGGAHSRLEHSLGAFDTAVMMLSIAYNFMMSKPNEYTNPARDLMTRAALVLALLHDAFHPPFGHVLDPLRPVILPQKDEPRIDNAAKYLEFAQALDERGVVHELLAKVYDAGRLQPILEMCLRLLDHATAPALPRDLKPYAFIIDILWGQLDHDRFDYLFRDVAHVFPFATERPLRLSALRDKIQCVEDTQSGEVRLTFNASDAELDEFLRFRQRMYNDVYEGHLKAPFDEMILHAVMYLLISHNKFDGYRDLAPDTDEWHFGLDFARLSDVDLVRLIDAVDLDCNTWIAKKLVGDLLANAPFRCAAHREIDNLEIPILAARYIQWRAPYERAVVDLASRLKLRPNRKEREDAIARLAKMLEGPTPVAPEDAASLNAWLRSQQYEQYLDSRTGDLLPTGSEPLFWLLHGFSLRAFHRLRVESWLWKRFCETWQLYHQWSSGIADAFARDAAHARGVDVDEVLGADAPAQPQREELLRLMAKDAATFRDHLSRTPLLFIHMSRVDPRDVTRMWLKDAGGERHAQRHSRATGGLVPVAPKPRKSLNNYWLGIFRPPTMAPAADKVIETLLEELLEKEWVRLFASASLDHLVL
jgi:HD superfamily phosphohydrolase